VPGRLKVARRDLRPTPVGVSLYPHEPLPASDPAPDDADAHVFARVEGLIGEEDALLRLPLHERTAAQRDRLRWLGDELDRLWELLSARAQPGA